MSRQGAMALSWSMDKIGPITRSAEDAAMVFAAIEGVDPKDSHTIAAGYTGYNAQRDIRKIKLGYVKADFEKDYAFKSQDSLVLIELEKMGVELVPIKLPDLPDIGFVLSAEAAAAFDELTRSGADDKMVRQERYAWPNTFREARLIPAVEYIQANRLRTILVNDMHELMQTVDAFVAPSWASNSLRITNLTGHPAICVPNGFDAEGMPTSITFTGRLFDEATILELAQAFQKRTEWDDKHPGL
ncbi:MAG: amidase family protein [Saprospiraceae bacterium]